MPTLIDWPTAESFPQVPSSSSYNTRGVQTVIHDGKDMGPPQSWSISVQGMKPFQTKWDLTTLQKIEFERWYTEDVANSAFSFNFWRPDGSGAIAPNIQVECKILDDYTVTSGGGDLWFLAVKITQLVA